MSPREHDHPWLRNHHCPRPSPTNVKWVCEWKMKKKEKYCGHISEKGGIYLSNSKCTPSLKYPQIQNYPGAFIYPIHQQHWKHICISEIKPWRETHWMKLFKFKTYLNLYRNWESLRVEIHSYSIYYFSAHCAYTAVYARVMRTR